MANKITRVFAALITASGILASVNALACSENDYKGSVCLMAATYCPDGFVPADGSPVTDPMLPSILGSNKLPSLQAPAGTTYCVSISGRYPQRP
ncbi:MAG: hypothetical protein KJ914_02515 [Gammaproteobacteria bacterium]|nr:hypothetical protein [Gammaproteobacteria bacterium]MBU1722594.1 hypothetical protein [Gammaproteobacteria bacterium]MBU2007066.1 hypothetical protein [Gammaproteobacteria bacterium]